MGIPLLQKLHVGSYLIRQNLSGRKRYPLVLMLEPLFRCNLACAGCGKIDYPDEILNQRISVADALQAVDECGAPVVSIAGGEPLLHKELPTIVKGIVPEDGFGSTALVSQTKMLEAAGDKIFTWNFVDLYGMNTNQLVVWNSFLAADADAAELTSGLQKITDTVRNDDSIKKVKVS